MILDALDCTPRGEVIVIEAQEHGVAETTVDALLYPLQPLREQFIAITGFGLEVEEPGLPGPTRHTLPAGKDSVAVSYLAAGDPKGQKVIFIHGSPGVAEEWGNFLLDVPADQYHLAVDRPGFGATAPERPVVELSAQARLIEPLLAADGSEQSILVGYSYGGPVALRLAADFPDRIGGVLLIGSAADPMEEEIHPLQSLAAMEMFAGLLSSELSNSNTELLALKDQLEMLSLDLERIEAPVTVVQGLRDTLVPPENAVYLQQHLSGTSVRVLLVEEGDHFLPWTHSDLLKNTLESVISCSQSGTGPSLPDPMPHTGDLRSD